MSGKERRERERGQLKQQLGEVVCDWKLITIHRTKRRKKK